MYERRSEPPIPPSRFRRRVFLHVLAALCLLAKLFASLFALYSGFVFVAMSGIVIAPIAHRILHYFHWEEGNSKSDE